MRPRLDLRLVPAAGAAWASALVLVGRPGGQLRRVLLVVLVAGVVALSGAVLVRHPRARALLVHGFGALVVVGVVALGLLVRSGDDVVTVLARAAASTPAAASTLAGGHVELVGALASDAVPSGRFGPGSWSADLDVRAVRVPGQERGTPAGGVVSVRGRQTTVGGAPGTLPTWRSTVVVTGTLHLPGAPATARDLRTSVGTEVTVSAERVQEVRPSPWWARWSDSLRRTAVAVCAGLSPQGRGLVPGIAIGDTTALPDDLAADMKTSGMTHMTAVSGSHFAVLGGLVWAALGWVRLPLRGRAVLLVLVTAALVVLVRPEPSVVRAAVMSLAGVLAVLARRPSSAVPALAASVLVLVVLSPQIAQELGFVLSVAATAGLVLLVPVVDARFARAPRWLREPFVVALCAQLPCAPVVALLSAQVSVWAVPANTVAALAVAPATVLGLTATLVGSLAPGLGHVLAWCASACTAWVAGVARLASRAPGAHLPWWQGATGLVAMALVSGCVVLLLVRADDLRWWLRVRVPLHVRAVHAVIRTHRRGAVGPRRRAVGDFHGDPTRLAPHASPGLGHGDARARRAGPGG